MSIVTVEEARARGIPLPADDDVAQEIIDGQEAWLARRIGPLTGERTETFYTGTYFYGSIGKLGLRRFTDDVDLTDGSLTDGAAVATDQYRLVDNGASVTRTAHSVTSFWNGPYVTATYSPNDFTEVYEAILSLIKLKISDAGGTGYQSEQIGSYSYNVGGGTGQGLSPYQSRAAIVASILPRHGSLTTISVVPEVPAYAIGDPVINRAEPNW